MEHDESVILGVDAGTTAVKTVAFTTKGTILGLARRRTSVQRGPDGAVEVSLDHMWEQTEATMMEVCHGLAGSGTAPIAAIGVTGQGDGAWLLSDDGEPARPAALWLDSRAASRLDQWTADGRADAVYRTTGSPLFPGALPILLDELDMSGELRQLSCKDWIRYQLTGVVVTDFTDASRGYLDTSTLDYSDDLLSRLGQEHVRAWLPPLHRATDIVGSLDAAVAAKLRIAGQPPIVTGMVDVAAMGIGLGSLEVDSGYAILGTTGFVGALRSSRSSTRAAHSISIATGRETEVLEALAPMTGTPNLDWVARLFGEPESPDFDELEQAANSVVPGCGGVMYLPYGNPSGERAPFVDTAASASWLGLSVSTSRAQLLRSVYEGLALAINECVRELDINTALPVCGGGSSSSLFCQILADLTERPVIRQTEEEVGARGAAILAATGAGLFSSLSAASDAFRPGTVTFLPDARNASAYRALGAAFTAVRDAIRPQWPRLRALGREPAASPTLSLVSEGVHRI